MRPDCENFPTGVKPRMQGVISFGDTRIELEDADFVSESLTFRESTSSSGEITVGAAMMTSCRVALWNDKGKFDAVQWTNSRITIWLVANVTETDAEVASMGTYYIVSHKTSGSQLIIEAYDPIKVMDEHSLGEVDIVWPIDAVDAVEKIAKFDMSKYSSIKIEGLEDARGISIPDPGDYDMTNRDALSYIAQSLGKYILMVSDTSQTSDAVTLLFGWYDTSTAYDVGTTFNHDLSSDDVTVSGVTVIADETNEDGSPISETRGSDGYKITIQNNPFINKDNVGAIADRINSAVSGLKFRPGRFSVESNAKIRAGDAVTVSTLQEKNILTLATDITYKPAAVKESISAHAADVSDLQVSSSLQADSKSYIRSVAKKTAQSVAGGGGGGSGGSSVIAGKTMTVSGSLPTGVSTVSGYYALDRDPKSNIGILSCHIDLTMTAGMSANSSLYVALSDLADVTFNSAFQQFVFGTLKISQYGNIIYRKIDNVFVRSNTGNTIFLQFRSAVETCQTVSVDFTTTVFAP